MRILVTGGAGFIGSNFIYYWLANHPDDTIVNLDSLTYAGNINNLRDLPTDRHIFIHGDICDQEAVHYAMDEVDVVIHFAAETHVDRSIKDAKIFLETNILGTHTLLEEVRKRGKQIKHFHHVSTDEVYGSLSLNDQSIFHENATYKPRSPYSASKAGSDHVCRAYFHTHDIPITISHCSNNYGPYQFPEKFIPLMIVSALNDQQLPIYGDGLYMRDWIHTEDHSRGIDAVLSKGRIGETYCLSGNSEKENIDVAKTILDILNKPHSLIKYVEDRKGHDRRYSIDSSKAKHELGWLPARSFDDGLRDTVEWYKNNEDWWKPLTKKS